MKGFQLSIEQQAQSTEPARGTALSEQPPGLDLPLRSCAEFARDACDFVLEGLDHQRVARLRISPLEEHARQRR